MAEESRRTLARRELSRRPAFSSVSPAPGSLDEAVFAEEMEQDPEEALALLADMAAATDPHLRLMARRLAGRIMIDLSRSGPTRRAGTGRITSVPLEPGGDLDVDASLEEMVQARAGRRAPRAEGLRSRRWARPATGLCLVVDRSGSMSGLRLATAALAAAAVAWRAPQDHSVIAFAEEVVVLKAQDEARAVEEVVEDLLRLRGRGPTNLDLALRSAGAQLNRSPAQDRVTLLLSDARATSGPEALEAARQLHRLALLAPRGDASEAVALARATGSRWAEVGGPTEVPGALAGLLGP